jgi:hypothetical protein
VAEDASQKRARAVSTLVRLTWFFALKKRFKVLLDVHAIVGGTGFFFLFLFLFKQEMQIFEEVKRKGRK